MTPTTARLIRGPLDGSRRARILEEFLRTLSLEVGSASLGRTVAAQVQQLIGCRTVAFCTHQPEFDGFVPAPANVDSTPSAGPAIAISAVGALGRWLRVNEEPLQIPDGRGVFEYLPKPEQEALIKAQVRLCVPMSLGGRLQGIVVAIDDEVLPPLSADALHLLQACGRHAALASERVARIERDREQAQATSRAQQLALAGQLASAVAHEIRNPLTAIRSTVQYIADVPEAWTGRQDLLHHVLDEVDRINRALSGLLGLARSHPLTPTRTDLVALANESLVLMAPYFDHHGVAVQGTFEPELAVDGDPDELRQVFLNLFMNACQAMSGGGTIVIRARRMNRTTTGGLDDCWAELAIEDSGIGVAANDTKRVFEPFFTTKPSGTGLGLAICREVIDRHHGTIRLESAPGLGTTVLLALPLASA